MRLKETEMISDERIAELTAEVELRATELQQAKLSPPDAVTAAQSKVDNAAAAFREAKSTQVWHTHTRELDARMRHLCDLENAVNAAKRERAITGREYDIAVAETWRRWMQSKQALEQAKRQQQQGAFFFSA